MKPISALFALLVCAIFLSTNWHCAPVNADSFSIKLDSLNNALLTTVDAFATIKTDDISEIDEVGFCWNESGGPTVDDTKFGIAKPSIPEIKLTVGDFSPAKKYFVRAFIRNGSKLAYSDEKSCTTWDGTANDFEGHIYKGVQIGHPLIGAQAWLAENLRSTKYADGSPIDIGHGSNRHYWYGSQHQFIPNFDDDIDGDGDLDVQDSLLYVNEYGLLYSWFAANNLYDHTIDATLLGKKVSPAVRDICPKGWHVPNHDDLQDLTNILGFQYGYGQYAQHLTAKTGFILGEQGFDTYGFNLKPNGFWHDAQQTHLNVRGVVAYFWASSETNDVSGNGVQVDNYDKKLLGATNGKANAGYCVRCLKDK